MDPEDKRTLIETMALPDAIAAVFGPLSTEEDPDIDFLLGYYSWERGGFRCFSVCFSSPASTLVFLSATALADLLSEVGVTLLADIARFG